MIYYQDSYSIDGFQKKQKIISTAAFRKTRGIKKTFPRMTISSRDDLTTY
mgnify:CR=1 FL=1